MLFFGDLDHVPSIFFYFARFRFQSETAMMMP